MVSWGSVRLAFLSKGLPGAAWARLKVMRATKNIVGMINRSRRMTYLSTGLNTECIARCVQNASQQTEGAGATPAPLVFDARGLALLCHVQVGEGCFLETEGGDIEVLHPWLLQDLGGPVVDERHRGVLGQDL